MKRLFLTTMLLLTASITTIFSQTPQTFFNVTDAFFGKYASNEKVYSSSIRSNPETFTNFLHSAKKISLNTSFHSMIASKQ